MELEVEVRTKSSTVTKSKTEAEPSEDTRGEKEEAKQNFASTRSTIKKGTQRNHNILDEGKRF